MFNRSLLVASLLLSPPLLAATPTLEQNAETLKQPTIDSSRSMAIQGVAFSRGAVRYDFKKGTLYPIVDAKGHDIGTVFLGDGTLKYTPESEYLQLHLYRWTWFKTQFEEDFSEGVMFHTGAPLFKGQWEKAGPKSDAAADILATRWALHEDWTSRNDSASPWFNHRGPNLHLDLMEAATQEADKSTATAPGMRFIEVNARPNRHAVNKAPPVWLSPERWWFSWYESPRGIMPLAKNSLRGALFVHGDSRYGYRTDVLYAFDPTEYGPLLADDVKTATHTIDVTWDDQHERMKLKQSVAITLADDAGNTARLGLVPQEPLSLGSQRNTLEPLMQVTSVRTSDKNSLYFIQENGEILVDLPSEFDGQLTLVIDSEIPLSAGAQSHSGPTYLYQPVGYNFDRVLYDMNVTAPGNVVFKTSHSQGGAGSVEAPAIAIGKYVLADAEAGDRKISGMGFEHQVFTGAAHAGQAREMLNVAENGGFSQSMDTGSQATQAGVDGKTRAQIFLGDAGRALRILEEVLGPLPSKELSIAQARGFHPAMADNVTSTGLMCLDESDLFFFDVSGQEAMLYTFQAQAYQLTRQWIGAAIPMGNELEDFYFFDGLRQYLSRYALEEVHYSNPFLDQFLDLSMRWAVRSEQKGRRFQLGMDSGWQGMIEGAEARGYLLFNNLRYAVGQDTMNLGLNATAQLLSGSPALKADLVTAMESAFSMDLDPLFGHGVALAPYTGTLAVSYHIEEKGGKFTFTAISTGENLGPTLGATVRVTFKDMSEGIIFVPLDKAMTVVLPQGIRKVKSFQRGSGLVKRVTVSEVDTL